MDLGSWLDVIAIVAATGTVAGMGVAGVVHAVGLARIERRGMPDRAIAAFGVAVSVLGVVLLALAIAAPGASLLVLHLAAAAWVVGVGFWIFLAIAAVVSLAARHAPAARTVVVLGAALTGTRPSPLLARRVDRGADAWRAIVRTEPAARIVVSGGQGRDEPVPEAVAMARHLVEVHGVPRTAIVLEDRSTSTDENLRHTLDLVGRDAGPFLVVTSEYHAPRTRMLMAANRMQGDVATSWSRPAYRPGATVREYLAGVVGSRRLLATLVVVAVLCEAVGVARAIALAA